MRLSPCGNIGAGGRLGRSAWNKNQFLVHKLLDAKTREFFSISRALYSAKRQIRGTPIRIVDEDHAGLHATFPVIFATISWLPVVLFSSFLWKKKRHVEPCRPTASAIRALYVAKELGIDIYGLLPEMHDLSNSAT